MYSYVLNFKSLILTTETALLASGRRRRRSRLHRTANAPQQLKGYNSESEGSANKASDIYLSMQVTGRLGSLDSTDCV